MKSKKNPLTTKIKMAMVESGLNQTELAKAIGITKQSLSGWLSSCENPKLENIKKIAKVTNKPLNYFIESINYTDDNKNKFTVKETGNNYEISLLKKEIEIIKKDIEILKLKIKK